MARLIYAAIASLDGYIADEDGKFDWAEPDEEVHSFINDLERSVGTHLLGRRMYEVLAYWDDPPAVDEQPAFAQDSPRSGRPRTRSSSPGPWRRRGLEGRASSGPSTPRPSDS